ncbi:hypothetical protein [Emticicia sp. BO119]|uniref:hypothetical protein n=1 Tax=Emticicia sp. BO119 TaxID=2757768 RepID=UPI0015F124C8|nr:hypothetical protein [Emticicia sp. BO119]MBA4849482.1 hypothetical protein [Emticicia sp. BO119]
MAKTLSVSKQVLIANYKSDLNANSGIEAGYVITPATDGTAGLKIYGRVRPDVNRVDLLPKTALGSRGITETAAQDKYMADLAALKTFFGLVNAGDTATAISMPWIKLDASGVYWDPQVATFPETAVYSVATTDGVTTDSSNTHKYLNYFDPKTGDFGSIPVKATADGTPTTETFFQKYKNWFIGGGIVAAVGVLAALLWPKKVKRILPKALKRGRR